VLCSASLPGKSSLLFFAVGSMYDQPPPASERRRSRGWPSRDPGSTDHRRSSAPDTLRCPGAQHRGEQDRDVATRPSARSAPCAVRGCSRARADAEAAITNVRRHEVVERADLLVARLLALWSAPFALARSSAVSFSFGSRAPPTTC
jgi:hypothetical protein